VRTHQGLHAITPARDAFVDTRRRRKTLMVSNSVCHSQHDMLAVLCVWTRGKTATKRPVNEAQSLTAAG
jgi:hypothetical protein